MVSFEERRSPRSLPVDNHLFRHLPSSDNHGLSPLPISDKQGLSETPPPERG
jgi:hypothetical protein